MPTEITEFYNTFSRYLKKQNNRLALLQITGKLEDYLVKEFIYHIHNQSKGKLLGIPNFGRNGERKYDIVVVTGQLSKPDDLMVKGIVEAKYFRNQHRCWPESAVDEISPGLTSLEAQATFKGDYHGGIKVSLSPRQKKVYVLIFTSIVSIGTKMDDLFSGKILNKANNFRSHNKPKSTLDTVYENKEVIVLNSPYFVTLKMGLWEKI